MKMKTIITATFFVIGIVGIVGNAMAAGMGPAPNSGDCIPDGSGFESTNGPNGLVDSCNGHCGSVSNSGDCIPDGSGFDSPNGSNGKGDSENGHHGPAPNSGDCIPDGSGW